ncbi:MAG TPA: type II toxin-antitoxin system prevent-host-death family antitoxin [Polyangia bacterium]|jgi:prevent-host-death family protein|nr:type II toxin-antitoxin system prevent-host-death family antitoxin [Polyangia bacterium]
MPRRVQAAEARRDFADLIDRSAKGERIKITRYRNTLAAIVSKKDLEKLEDCEETEEAAAEPRAPEAVQRPETLPPPRSRRTRRRSPG